MPDSNNSEPGSLLSPRATLILLTGTLLGGIAGALTLAGGGNTAASLLAGLTAAGVGIASLHRLIGH
ncbi:hypothetical protein DMH26_17600 [Streptomyces sp. WAC 05379]|nr:hypothetical protein DMH26_17600 [Streptomyces sp. WAC 05379]